MSDQITQQLGIDASSALSALASLDSAFASFEQRLKSVASAAGGFNAAFGKINPATLATGLTSTASAASTAGQSFDRAARSTSGFGISLETLTRVVSTQLIVRTMTAIRSAVEDSFQGFTEFNRKVAEIQTISQGEGLEHLAAGVRNLSDEFNSPILDVAKAKYQALSNGFVSDADSASLLTSALKLGKISVASTTESVDLLSTALNAYGKSVESADDLTGKLFKTVQLGRTTGSELSSAFGRVAPVAKELGASTDEVLAAFSSLTIGGVKTSEAATQIRASLTALLKPSEDMIEAFKKLGVSSGEQLVQAKGYAGAFKSVIDTTDGSATAIARLFPNVRALTGVLRETGTAAEIFKSHLQDIQTAGRALANQTYKLRIDADSERVDAALNKLKNFFTVDLGSKLVKTTAGGLQLVGGVDTLVTALDRAVPVAGAASVAIGAYGLAASAAAIRTDLLRTSAAGATFSLTSLRGALTLATAAFAAYQAGQFIGDNITRFIESDRAAAQKAATELLESQRNANSQAAQIDEAAAAKKIQTVQSAFQVIRGEYFKSIDAARQTNEELIANDQSTLDKIIQAHSRFALDNRRASQQAQNDIIQSEKHANDVRGQLSDAQFNFQNSRWNDLTKAARDAARAQQLASAGGSLLSSASTPDQKAAADSAFQRAESFARQAISSAQTTGNITAQYQAELALERVLQTRIVAEGNYQQQRARDADALNKKAADEEARVTRLKSLAKDFLENANGFDKKTGEALPTDKLAQNFAKAKADLEAFKNEAFSGSAKFGIEDLFNFDKLQQRFDQTFTQGEVKQLFATPSALDSLFKQIQGSADTHKILLSFATDPSKLKGLTEGQALDEVGRQTAASGDELSRQRVGNTARLDNEQAIKAAIDEANRSYREQKGLVESLATSAQFSLSTKSFDQLATDQTKLAGLRSELQQLIQQPAIAAEQVNRLADAFTQLQKSASTSLGTDISRAANEFSQLVTVFEAQRQEQTRAAQGINPGALQGANQQLDANVQRAAQFTQQAEQSASRLSTDTNSAAQAASRYADFMARAAQEAERARAAQASAPTGRGFALGGQVDYFAAGGLARGTDTIPAMLTKGETVIDAHNSRRFFSELTAIRAGTPPAASQSSVSNVTGIAGDVSINVQGGPTNAATAKAVADALNRATRRGVIGLRR